MTTQTKGTEKKKHSVAPSEHPLYDVWRTIKRRCYDRSYKDFGRYGGRGITMCKEWKEDYMSFYNWALAHGWKKGLTLDRVCNERGYSPYNCKFVSRRVQANNRSTNTKIKANGMEHTIAQWSRINHIEETTIIQRITRGWDPAKAVTTPSREYKWKGE